MIKCAIILGFICFALSCKESAISNSKRINFNIVSELKSTHSDTLDFGTLISGEVIEYNIGVVNNDKSPVVILNVTADCGCTTMNFPKEPILQGDTACVKLRYDSKSQQGWQFKSIRILNSSSNIPKTIYFSINIRSL